MYADAIAALNRADWPDAERLSRHMLQHFGEHPRVHFVAGVAATEMRRLPAALRHLSRAVEMEAGRADALVYLAKALAIGGSFREAGETADRAMALAPDDPLLLDTLGVVYTEAGNHAAAARAFSQVVGLSPDRANGRFNLASALLYAGDLAAAEKEYEACLALDERFWKAYPALSSLRRQTERANHLARWRGVLERQHENPAARTYLNLALGKECEDLGDHAGAFAHFGAGKAAARPQEYSPEEDRKLFDAIMAAFPAAAERKEGGGCGNGEPIFVVGMPRSGTTLVERILSSHPQVDAAGELHHFPIAVKRASGSRTRQVLDAATLAATPGIDWKGLGERYIESTRPISGRSPRFVDKLPHNFLYIGHILHALPDASVVCLRRNPLDTCLGNFRQLFSLSSPFTRYSFDLLDIGRYYVLFDRLMAHWRQLFPGRVMELRYEDLVMDQEKHSRMLLAHCGLPWDDACLRFEHNPAPTATASVVQVREPIQRGYMGRWRRYEAQLAPLRDLLARNGIAME